MYLFEVIRWTLVYRHYEGRKKSETCSQKHSGQTGLLNLFIDVFKLMQLFQFPEEKHEKKKSLVLTVRWDRGGNEFLFEDEVCHTTEYCNGLRVRIIKIYQAGKLYQEIRPTLEQHQQKIIRKTISFFAG